MFNTAAYGTTERSEAPKMEYSIEHCILIVDY
jgi:hypothetical protein